MRSRLGQLLLQVIVSRLRDADVEDGVQLALLCGVLKSCVERLGQDLAEAVSVDDVVEVLARCTRRGKAGEQEALMAVGALARSVEGSLELERQLCDKVPAILPGLLAALQDADAACGPVAAEALGVLARTLGARLPPQHCADALRALLAATATPAAARSPLRVRLLSALADFALAAPAGVAPLLREYLDTLQQAAALQPQSESEAEIVQQLHEAACEGFTNVVQGFHQAQLSAELLAHCDAFVAYATDVLRDGSGGEYEGAVELLGYLAQALGEQNKVSLATTEVRALLDGVLQGSKATSETAATARWTKEQIFGPC
eukprot:TRINITY_DN4635_c0_g1_i1.p1 TRINITY_DN4635_c0_g1~~TRINITY_DN4635_c0_g1_i1.p1  ORF type:complete len:318 (-),score=101.66 TRINITY_DN4635_c0_g1_i1:78-1031(-)